MITDPAFPIHLSNMVTSHAFNAMLATEGVKAVAAQYDKTISGKTAMWTFFVVLLVPALTMSVNKGQPSDLYYVLNTALHGLSAIGLYNFLKRTFDALKKTPEATPPPVAPPTTGIQ